MGEKVTLLISRSVTCRGVARNYSFKDAHYKVVNDVHAHMLGTYFIKIILAKVRPLLIPGYAYLYV